MRFVIFSILSSLFLVQCLGDRFTGYNYTAGNLQQTTMIQGTVLNKFTGNSVENALVEINHQSTQTNSRGQFEMLYILTEDDNLNRPAPITVTAENYLPFTTSQVIFPLDTLYLTLEIEYGAPIIEAASLPEFQLCQVIVLDYQGVEDIQSVTVRLTYVDASGTPRNEIELPLLSHGQESEIKGYFQTAVSPTIDNLTLSPLINVTAVDKEGFSHSIFHLNDPRNPDQLLFPE